jgi:hypothetical protein
MTTSHLDLQAYKMFMNPLWEESFNIAAAGNKYLKRKICQYYE